MICTKDKNFAYQVKVEPTLFIPMLVKMSREIEEKGEKTFNVFPLRKNNIPKYIKLDTATVIQLFLKENKGFYMTKGNTKRKQWEVWEKVFKMNKKVFRKKGYRFCGEVSTDGFACSILFIREDLYNPNGKNKVPKARKPVNFSNEQYIDDIDERKKTELSDKKIVGIDPGKCDLLYCVSEEDGKLQKFRYSNVQRVKETKSKHYSKIIEKIKKNEHIRACAHRIGNTVERLQREKLFFRNDNGLHKNKKRSQCESVHTLSQRTLS